jgi:hypothetical protein
MPMPMKELFFISGAVGLLAVATLFGAARAEDKGLPLSDLAGSFAGKGVGFRAVCFAGGTPATCSTPSSTAVEFNEALVVQGTRAQDGTFCFTATDVLSPVAGSEAQATVSDLIAVGSTASYDPVTEKGTFDVSLFNAADGVSCRGATVVNPNGAKPTSTSTLDFAVSQGGNRFDFVATTFIDAAGTFGGSVLNFTAHRQTPTSD